MQGFLDVYALSKSSKDHNDTYRKDPYGKACRFCGQGYPEVQFSTLPHLIPELFGRNSTSSNFECDKCNNLFQKYETDAATMFQHYLSLLNIKSKRGVPAFRSKKDAYSFATSMDRGHNNLNIKFGNNLSDFEFDDEKKTFTLNLRTRNFIPFSIYKVMLKIGISLLSDQDLADNTHFLEFLHTDQPIDNGIQIWLANRYMLRTKYYQKPIAQLYKARHVLIDDRVYPEFVLVLYFANVVMQCCLPISGKNIAEYDPNRRLVFEMFPSFALEDMTMIKSIEMHNFDMKETAKVSITDKIVLYYKSLEENI